MFELGRIRFRPFSEEDLSNLEKWENTRDITLYSRGRPYVFKNINEIKEDFEEYQENEDKQQFVIELKENDKKVGIVNYEKKSDMVRTADIGTYIGEREYWDQGIGKEITLGLCEILIYHKNYDRLSAWSSAFNKRSHKVLKAVGFKKGGRARKSGYLFGKRVDWLMFDILRSEYLNEREAILEKILGEEKERYVVSQCKLRVENERLQDEE